MLPEGLVITAALVQGDARALPFADACAQCCVTSPPFWGLRDYGVDGQIGLEATPDDWVAEMVVVFREVRRVLRDDGVAWVEVGDSYNNFRSQMGPGQGVHGRAALHGKPAVDSRRRGVKTLKEKDLCGIPWRLAFALQSDGWWLRSDCIWARPNPMPESVTDRPTKAHSYVFLLTKSQRYFYDAEAVRQNDCGRSWGNGFAGRQGGAETDNPWSPGKGANVRTVWTIPTHPFSGAHFATMPPALAERCIKAGSRRGDLVLDPFMGAGTTALAAQRLGRNAAGVELNADYIEIARRRVSAERMDAPLCSVKPQRKDAGPLFGGAA